MNIIHYWFIRFCSYMPKRTGTAFRWSNKEQERRSGSGAFRLETNPGHGALLLTDSLVQDGVIWRLFFSDTDHFRDVIVVTVSLLPALQPLPCQLSPWNCRRCVYCLSSHDVITRTITVSRRACVGCVAASCPAGRNLDKTSSWTSTAPLQ